MTALVDERLAIPPELVRPSQPTTEQNRAYRHALQWWVQEYKARTGCQGKGPHSGRLTFHHRDPAEKRALVPNMVSKGRNFGMVRDEIARCDVLCVACHRRLNGEPEMVTWR